MARISDSPEVDALPAEAIVPVVEAGLNKHISQEALLRPARMGLTLGAAPLRLPGRYRDFGPLPLAYSTLEGAFTGGAPTDAAFATYARAGTRIEPAGNGTFASFLAGVPAYARDADGSVDGIAVRPAATQKFDYPQNFAAETGGAVAFWPRTGTNKPTTLGTGPLGVDHWKVPCDTTNGAHSIRQAKAASAIGKPLSFSALWSEDEIDGIELGIASGAVGETVLVAFDSSGLKQSVSGTPDFFHSFHLGAGWWFSWVSDTATGTANAAYHCYLRKNGQREFQGVAGEGIKLASLDLTETRAPVFPILQIDAVDVTVPATTLTTALNGQKHAKIVSFRNSHLTHAEGGYVLCFHKGTVADEIAVLISGGKYLFRMVAGGVVKGSAQLAAVGKEALFGIDYDETTGVARCFQDGELVASLSAPDGPTGLTHTSLGHDGAGLNQVNASIRFDQDVPTIPGAAEMAAATSGAGTASVRYDKEEIFVTGDGLGGARIWGAMAGSEDGLDYWDQSVTLVNSPPGENNATGLRSDQVNHVRRIDEREFGASLRRLIDDNPAEDDSMREVGVPVSTNYNAAIVGESGHGNVRQEKASWLLDARPYTPQAGVVARGHKLQLRQQLTYISFVDGLDYLSRYGFWEWTREGKLYRPRWVPLLARTADAASYPGMMSSNVGTYTTETRVEGSSAIGDGVVANTTFPIDPYVTVSDATYALTLAVVEGWLPGAVLFAQDNGQSATRKIYYKPKAANFNLVPGTDLQFGLRHSYGFVA